MRVGVYKCHNHMNARDIKLNQNVSIGNQRALQTVYLIPPFFYQTLYVIFTKLDIK